MSLIVQTKDFAIDLFIIGADHASIPGGDRFIDVEAKNPGVPNRTHAFALITGAERLGAVFEQQQAMLAGDGF